MPAEFSVEPVRKQRVSHHVAVEICRMIRDGNLRPGDNLPAERDLARMLQVSRASLREALRGLEIGGIIESRHGGGTVVRRFSAFGTESPLAMIFEASHDLVSDLWEVRRIVEPAFAERAAVRATEDGVDWLRQMLERHREPYGRAGTGAVARRLDREFHGAVASLSGNEAAEQVIQLLNSLVHRGYHAQRSFILERRKRAYARHTAIYEAIRDGDPVRARKSMLDHLEEIEEYILEELIDVSRQENSNPYRDVDKSNKTPRRRANGGAPNAEPS
jgi:GntR family transcriptional repressor for pyruvate dehydrogenase complex